MKLRTDWGAGAVGPVTAKGSDNKNRVDGENDELVLQDTFAQETAVTVEDPNIFKKISDSHSLKRLSKLQAKEYSYAPADMKQMGAVFPFKPMTITFENVQYFVDTPKKMREKGYQQRFSITGSFQPAVLTALMGVMQLLSGNYFCFLTDFYALQADVYNVYRIIIVLFRMVVSIKPPDVHMYFVVAHKSDSESRAHKQSKFQSRGIEELSLRRLHRCF
ncbi:hypothetical protein ACET3Z_012707 [Daucus carota]